MALPGREADVRRVIELIAATPPLPGQVRLVRIDGEIGIGKSAVLASALARVTPSSADRGADAGPRVFVAHGDRLHAEAPLAAPRTMIEEILAAPLEDLLDRATPSVLGARCASALGGSTAPVVIAVDDAHWLDPASERFLVALMQTPMLAPLTVVTAHRPGRSPAALVDVARGRGALHDRVALAPLADDVIDEMAEALTSRQRSAVVDASRGNPLFARATIAGFQRHPTATRADEVLELADGSHSAVLSAATADDMATLDARTRGVLEAIAVIGPDVDLETLVEVEGLDDVAVTAAARELVDRGLLSGAVHERLHPVLRVAVYRNMGASRRTQLHRRAAHAAGAELFERADHLARVVPDITDEETEVLTRAASVAIGIEPETVVDWLGGLDPSQHTRRSRVLHARAQLLTGRAADAISGLEEMVSADPGAVEARIVLANVLRIMGDVDEARALLAIAEESIDAVLLREYVDILAMLDGRTPERLLSRLETLPGALNRVVAAVYRTMDLLSVGDVRHARVSFRAVAEWARVVSGDELETVLHAAACAVWAAYMLDEFETGARLAERGLRRAHRIGQVDVLANFATGLSFCHASLGLLDEADAAGERAVADARRYGPAELESMALAGLMVAAQGRADLELLRERFERLEAAPLPAFGWWRRAVLTTRTRVSAMIGQPTPCPELLGGPRDAMASLRYADAAAVAAALGQGETATALIDEGLEIAREQESRGQEAMVLTCHAEILLRSGDPLAAGNLFRTARDTFDRLEMRLQYGRAHHGLAQAEALLRSRSEQLTVLTAREREIAELVAAGLRNRQIAERLVVSPRTPEQHIRNIMKKLGVSSREAIVQIVGGGRSSAG